MDSYDDDFLTLDVRRALLAPASSATTPNLSSSCSSPQARQPGEQAFDDILSNAESLVRRMRDAYLVRSKTCTPIVSVARSSRHTAMRSYAADTHGADSQTTTRSRSSPLQDDELGDARLRASGLRTRLNSSSSSPSQSYSSYPSSDDGSSDCEGSVFSHGAASCGSATSSLGDYEDVDLGDDANGTTDGSGMGLEGLDLAEQNRRLKARVAQLEEALEGCLGLVSGSGF